MQQTQEMFELLTRILCDIRPPKQAEGAYLFGQTVDNQQSVFEAAIQLLEQSLTAKILLIASEAKSGYPGITAWRNRLLALTVDETRIQAVEIEDTPSLNTLIEAEALVRFAKRKGLTTLFVVAAPFHQMRAFMTVVTVALRRYPRLRLYSYPGTVFPWHQEVAHSQGKTIGTRSSLIKGELDRINRYQGQGDLASFEAILTYLNKRDLSVLDNNAIEV